MAPHLGRGPNGKHPAVDAVFYSLAFGGSQIAPVQLARSLESLRLFDPAMPVFVFLFGEPPRDFIDVLGRFNAQVRHLGDYRAYVARTEPDRADFFSLDPKLHRWLVLGEPELKTCSRLLYIDSDTLFFAPPSALFSRYRDADLYAREEPGSRRSVHGYHPSLIDEDELAALRVRESVGLVPPFNTGVCLFTRKMADSISAILPHYFGYLFRFLSWFHFHPIPGREPEPDSTRLVHERFLGPSEEQALPYPSKNRWIADQFALWLALGRFTDLRYGDFRPADVWQGAEFQQLRTARSFPLLCHYFGGNTMPFFELLQRLPARGTVR